MSSGFNSGFSPPFFGVVSGSGGGGGGGTTLTGLLELTGSFSSRQYNGLAALSPNADFVLQPSGSNGSLLAQAPDGTIAGGNARGNRAVDWQQERNNANQVASGLESTVGGGRQNRASGAQSTVAGGGSNTASGIRATIAGGGSHTASSIDATVAGGNVNTASANYTTVAGGLNNTASGIRATIPGGERGLADRTGMLSHASGRFSIDGDAQYSRMILRRQTTDATPTVLHADGGSGSAATRVIIPVRTSYMFDVHVIANQSAGTAGTASDSAWWKFSGGINRDNSNNTALIGGVAISTDSNPGAAGWQVFVTADNTNNALQVEVIGEADKTIRWVATVHLTKASY